ncbi:DUF937 domain-containing protein [Streptomyces sp. H27-C3]|uniref:DUF937 domain-containing protein n=1 Tax=Streptomyces sp. H27-C3 TaxID=3046305 RepID=UPI0024BBBEED|nr:DUF937 domain-containing protein [Streptomyces sp. H27-C3]MDJ0463680.1 DUF937 domain-containing protein [Streptomyces sp. H27-C3]
MNDDSLQKDVLDELGDDKLQEIAGLLGTDTAGAQDVVQSSVSALSGGLEEKAVAATPEEAEEVRLAIADAAEPPLQGVATLGGGLGGMLSGGLMGGVLAKIARPAAAAVAKRTGLPVASVTKAFEVVLPVVVAVLSKRAARGKATASGGGGLGDLLGGLLGGGGAKK